jgi:hypothetical protein
MAQFRDHGFITSGKIIDIEKSPALHGGWIKEYDYFINGKKFTGRTSEPIFQAKIGDSLVIVYLPDEPDNSTFLNDESTPHGRQK